MKLITIKDYLLLIDKGAEIKEGTKWVYDNDKPSIIPLLGNTNIVKEGISKGWFQKIIAYRKLNENAKELDLPLLPNPFNKDKYIKDLAKQRWGNVHRTGVLGFIEGYKAAQSKQFSLEDIKTIIKWLNKNYSSVEDELFEPYEGREDEVPDNFFYNVYEEALNRGIQSLSTQQLPKEFILGIGDTIEEQIKNGKYEY